MVNEDTIKRALDNRAGKGEAEEVAAYFGTDYEHPRHDFRGLPTL